MKKIIKAKVLVIFIIMLVTSNSLQAKGGHSIKFKINGLKDTVCYLASYYGAKQYYYDTAQVDSKGYFSFEGKDSMPGGIYSIILPDKKNYFEFIITEQEFYMETDTTDLVGNMKINGSKENTLFYEYLNFINKKQAVAGPLRKELARLTKAGPSDSLEIVREQLRKVNKEVKSYKIKFIDDNRGSLVAKIFNTSREPEVPDEKPLLPDGSEDSLFAFRYFKAHYFDDVDFSDERLLRTPVLHNKIEHYIIKLTMQTPDSINAGADFLVQKSRANKEIFKYMVHYITNHYERSKIMGMDAVFVHMAEEYYMKGECFWMDSTQLAKLTNRAKTLSPLLLGKVAPNLILQDTLGHWHILDKLESKYTILYIWDPDCGHCKKETPKLKKFYKEFKDKGVEVFAVSTEFENKLWKKYLRENPVEWINVSDSPEFPSNFRSIYDVFSTPIVFVLDKDKKILAKRLSVEQLEDFIKKLKEKDQG